MKLLLEKRIPDYSYGVSSNKQNNYITSSLNDDLYRIPHLARRYQQYWLNTLHDETNGKVSHNMHCRRQFLNPYVGRIYEATTSGPWVMGCNNNNDQGTTRRSFACCDYTNLAFITLHAPAGTTCNSWVYVRLSGAANVLTQYNKRKIVVSSLSQTVTVTGRSWLSSLLFYV